MKINIEKFKKRNINNFLMLSRKIKFIRLGEDLEGTVISDYLNSDGDRFYNVVMENGDTIHGIGDNNVYQVDNVNPENIQECPEDIISTVNRFCEDYCIMDNCTDGCPLNKYKNNEEL